MIRNNLLASLLVAYKELQLKIIAFLNIWTQTENYGPKVKDENP